MDYQATLYNPTYNLLGVSALLDVEDVTDPIALTVIDQTKGVEIPQADGIQLQAIKPVATARMVEVTDKGLSRENFKGATLTFNGKSWRISSHLMKPSPNGEADGEVYFILSEANVTT